MRLLPVRAEPFDTRNAGCIQVLSRSAEPQRRLPFALSLSKGERASYYFDHGVLRSCFDKPVLSEVEGLSTNGLLPSFPYGQ
jgi:hypothetical protein